MPVVLTGSCLYWRRGASEPASKFGDFISEDAATCSWFSIARHQPEACVSKPDRQRFQVYGSCYLSEVQRVARGVAQAYGLVGYQDRWVGQGKESLAEVLCVAYVRGNVAGSCAGCV